MAKGTTLTPKTVFSVSLAKILYIELACDTGTSAQQPRHVVRNDHCSLAAKDLNSRSHEGTTLLRSGLDRRYLHVAVDCVSDEIRCMHLLMDFQQCQPVRWIIVCRMRPSIRQ